MTDCIFCKIVNGELPSYKVWEDENHIAILNIFPQSKGNTIIVTKEHKPSYILENDQDTLNNLMSAMTEVAKILDEKLPESLRTTFVIEGLEVPHLHAKLIPFYKEMLKHAEAPIRATDEELEQVHKMLIN